MMKQCFRFLLLNTVVIPPLAVSSVLGIAKLLLSPKNQYGLTPFGKVLLNGSGSLFLAYILQRSFVTVSFYIPRVLRLGSKH